MSDVLRRLRPSSLITHLSSLSTRPSSLITAAAVIFLLQILLIVKIALLELMAFWSLFFLAWAIA